MDRVRPKADHALGWVFRPDDVTVAALDRGRRKLREHPELGADRPHRGGLITEALAEERTVLDKARHRRRRMAKKVTLKEMAKRSKRKADFGEDVKPSPMKLKAKEAKSNGSGKMIPLKAICADMELDPKATRVKLRRLIESGEIDFHDLSQRWEFTPSQAKEIRSHLE